MYSVPRDPLQLVDYAFQALGKNRVSTQQLIFFISFDLRQFPPSRVMKILQDLQGKGRLEIDGDEVVRPQGVLLVHEPAVPTSSADLGEQLQLFVSSSRLSRAVGMADNAIEFQRLSKTPLRIQAVVHGSRKYSLELDEGLMQISHDCPDWQRVRVIHRFCKHVAKLFLLLEKDEALRVLRSLQKDSWEFKQI
ncbi:MAG: hypothetical protein ACXADB_01345 [Candidatus Hermodarchaeia archaeon]|jgi:hypothetical protein